MVELNKETLMRGSKNISSYFGIACRILLIPALLIIGIPGMTLTAGIDAPSADWANRLESQAETMWGTDDIRLPGPEVMVQFEPDLGEYSFVDFKNGKACVKLLLNTDASSNREAVIAHLEQGIGNLILREPRDPIEMIKNRHKKTPPFVVTESGSIIIPPGKALSIYQVEKGDSIWTISRKFGMEMDVLIQLNDLGENETLHIGRPIKVIVFSSHDLTLDPEPVAGSDSPFLLDQIRMVDGSPVSPSMVRDFTVELLETHPPKWEKVIGGDGIERLVVSVEFTLVSNHVEIRARKFYPMVREKAIEYDIDPAVVMAIIHTESMFNPMARSNTPAYGLMQVVPYGGGREAYNAIYESEHKLTPQYLYDPENNIELGTAYFSILKDKYMRIINDPESRLYCAVAAYNAGASNVGRAFIPQKSIKLAASEINRMNSHEVYQQLVKKLPFKESRRYVRKVFTRAELYLGWN